MTASEVSEGVPHRFGPDASVVLLGVAFCLVYLAFNGAQNLQTSTSTELAGISLGSWSLGALYLANTVSGLAVAVPACAWTTDRNAVLLWIGAVPLFIAANVVYPEYFMIPVSIIAGLSAGVQWTACWGYLSSCIAWRASQQHAALLTGVFYGIMQSSQIWGNLASSLMLHQVGDGSGSGNEAPGDASSSSGDDDAEGRLWLAVLYGSSCAVGIGLLFLLPNLKRESKPLQMPLGEKLTGMCRLLTRDVRMSLMLVLFVYSGYTQNYFFGVFTKQVSDERSTSDIGYVMVAFGIADSILSFLLGWAGSRVGGAQVIAVSSLACAAGIAVLLALKGSHTLFSLAAVALLFGTADAGYNAIIVSTLTRMYPKKGGAEQIHNSACAFAAFQCVQSGTTAAAFFYATSISVWANSAIFASMLGCATVAYAVLTLRYVHHYVDPAEQQPILNETPTAP